MTIKLEAETEKYLLASIKRFFAEELDEDIGGFKAMSVLDYLSREVAPSVYNQAIVDAQSFFQDKVSDLGGVHHAAEFAYWQTLEDAVNGRCAPGGSAGTCVTGWGRRDGSGLAR